jgi:hypothetical protein
VSFWRICCFQLAASCVCLGLVLCVHCLGLVLCVHYKLLKQELFDALQRTFNGVFATHQHALFTADLGLFQSPDGTGPGQLQRTETWCITAREDSDPADTTRNDTDFLIVPGVNTTSLAFRVAEREVRAHVHPSLHYMQRGCDTSSLARPRCMLHVVVIT